MVAVDAGGGRGGGDFALEDFNKFFVFRFTIGPEVYKYMRIYLYNALTLRIRGF